MASGPAFEAFLWSLTQQESGGNYRAVGPPTPYGRAYGRYQVLAPNVGPWTVKHYGRRLTPQQFLNNRAAQDAVVRGVLGGYYDRYGARGAASMWYSGQPNWRKTYGHPPVYQYVNSVINRASRYPGGSTTPYSGRGSTYQVAAARPKLTKSERAEQYGLSMRLINSSKELRRLFGKAVAGSWSANRFTAALKTTRWWRRQSSTLRKYVTLKQTDPATWKQNRSNSRAKIRRLAAQVGVDVGKMPGWLYRDAVYYDLALGWNDARLKDWLGSKVKVHGGKMLGEAGEAFDALHELAYLNGVKYSTSWYATQARKIAKGTSTLQNQENKIRRQAAATYKAYAAQIKAGMNALDLAAPYIKSVSEILEIPETDIDLSNNFVYNAMAGGHAGANFPLWEFERIVRKDPLWKKTNNAREAAFGVAHQVLRDFGMAY
ncbi:hypothetical protein [Streptomyces halobius]|uniref:Transglycosylase SLT domain-containing protein n=1 Tax=Streptomyces halobius TaxID=2879846 RepID=A0ABY4M5J6_9ACTN|nr:hypothetical protein [Streptomyces halobius]UQA91636.1 hypothetical protein K9S39_06975 [Streptomyces halobius]